MAGSSLVQQGAERVWRINPAVGLHWRLVDDQWVVFEHNSGTTHQLDALPAAVLMAFEAGRPLDVRQLLEQVREDLGQQEIMHAHLQTVLQQLVQLELVLQ